MCRNSQFVSALLFASAAYMAYGLACKSPSSRDDLARLCLGAGCRRVLWGIVGLNVIPNCESGEVTLGTFQWR